MNWYLAAIAAFAFCVSAGAQQFYASCPNTNCLRSGMLAPILSTVTGIQELDRQSAVVTKLNVFRCPKCGQEFVGRHSEALRVVDVMKYEPKPAAPVLRLARNPLGLRPPMPPGSTNEDQFPKTNNAARVPDH